jgi:glycosyltransferase involved in cell wall biosynthesis
MNNPKVTVIIPVYKVEKYLRGSVQSVLDQTYKNIDIILVDDGSPDTCPQICDEFSEKFNNIRVVHKKNGGLSSARNAGLDLISETDYVLFLDSDDKLPPNAIGGMVQKAQCDNADMVIPDRYTKVYEDGNREEIAIHFPAEMYRVNPYDFALDVLMEQGRAWRASALLYSYSVIEKTGARFPIGRIAEDISFNFLVLEKANKIVIYPESTLLCLKHEGSITSTFQKNFEKDIWYIDEQVQVFLKKTGLDNNLGMKKADSLLCRNVVVYLFNIMSHNNAMSYKDKVTKAQKLLAAPEAKNCVRRKHTVPYFEKRKVQIAFSAVYWMLRHNMDRLVFRLLSCF